VAVPTVESVFAIRRDALVNALAAYLIERISKTLPFNIATATFYQIYMVVQPNEKIFFAQAYFSQINIKVEPAEPLLISDGPLEQLKIRIGDVA